VALLASQAACALQVDVHGSDLKLEATGSGESLTADSSGDETSFQGAAGGFVTLPIVLAGGVAAFAVGGAVGPMVPAKMVPYLVCAIYICFSVAIDVSIAVQKKGGSAHGDSAGYAFNPVCAVLLTEAVKFCISMLIYLISVKSDGRPLVPPELSFADAKWLAVPAIIFTVNNVLVFEAIGKNDVSTFGVFRDTMILWTACMWRCVFNVQLGWARLGGIFIVFLGLVVNKVFSSRSSGDFSWMFMWVLLMTLCNAAGSVANEYALKQNRSLDINVQNMVLYSFCVVCSLAFLAATDPARIAGTFFAGFDSHTWLTIGLQSLVGLLVSRLLKHTDSVMKTIATCLRGPVFVMISPIFTHISSSAAACMSAVIVASGCFTYLAQGPLTAAPAAKK
jgi:drug/metabolite transporter (DMT)-like permease